MKVLVLHGTHGNGRENWFPWLKEELEKIDIECVVPNLPNSDMSLLKEWLGGLEKQHKFLDSENLLVTHSLGCILALRALESGTRVKGAILVAPFGGILACP